MFSMELFHKAYDTDTTEMVVCDRKFYFYTPRSIDRFIDPDDVLRDFPLWSKIWEASWVLADYLARIPTDPERRFLEIGSGMGLVSIIAASFGHRMTLTEGNRDSLNFARANALLNNRPELDIVALDWNEPKLDGAFDYIVGSEIAYKEESFHTLQNLFESFLAPSGEIILTAGVRETSIEFFKQMQQNFNILAQKKMLRSEDEQIPILQCRLTKNK